MVLYDCILFLHDFTSFSYDFSVIIIIIVIIINIILEVGPHFYTDRFFSLSTLFRIMKVRPEIPTTTELFNSLFLDY